MRNRKGLFPSSRAHRVSAGFRGPFTIWLRGGTYRLAEPVVFGPDDGGPVTYSAYPGEIPVIDGSQRITNWRESTVDGVPLWVAELDEVARGTWSFRELCANGERRPRPRYPRDGLLRMASVPGLPERAGWEDGRDYTRFVARPGDLRPFGSLPDVEIVCLHFCIGERSPVESLDPATGMVTMAGPSAAPL